MDMFDHRMYCLSYLAWQKMHLSGDENRRDNNALNNVLLSLGGISPQTISVTGLAYTAFYSPSVRSWPGLSSYSRQSIKSVCRLIPFVALLKIQSPMNRGFWVIASIRWGKVLSSVMFAGWWIRILMSFWDLLTIKNHRNLCRERIFIVLSDNK